MAVFYLMGSATHSVMFGCVIQTKNTTIVIDGGTLDDSQQLANFLIDNADSHVNAWFFTHPHHDHIGAFCQLTKEYPQIQIDQILHHFPAIEQLELHGKRFDGEVLLWKQFFSLLEERYASRFLCKGDCFCFDDVIITVLRVANESIIDDFGNNSSTVYRVEGTKSSMLILGDLGFEGSKDLLQNCDRHLLRADYTQMAHHGNGGCSRAFYELIRPQRCIWACSDSFWNNDAGNGFDTGPWETVRTREWVEALGAMEHFVMKDRMQRIIL